MLVDILADVKGIDGGERRLLEAEESADGLLRHDGVQPRRISTLAARDGELAAARVAGRVQRIARGRIRAPALPMCQPRRNSRWRTGRGVRGPIDGRRYAQGRWARTDCGHLQWDGGGCLFATPRYVPRLTGSRGRRRRRRVIEGYDIRTTTSAANRALGNNMRKQHGSGPAYNSIGY